MKSYNALLRERNLNPIYITEHLPKKFQLECKKLLPYNKEAKFNYKKVAWKAENGHYLLDINDAKVELPSQ